MGYETYKKEIDFKETTASLEAINRSRAFLQRIGESALNK